MPSECHESSAHRTARPRAAAVGRCHTLARDYHASQNKRIFGRFYVIMFFWKASPRLRQKEGVTRIRMNQKAAGDALLPTRPVVTLRSRRRDTRYAQVKPRPTWHTDARSGKHHPQSYHGRVRQRVHIVPNAQRRGYDVSPIHPTPAAAAVFSLRLAVDRLIQAKAWPVATPVRRRCSA